VQSGDDWPQARSDAFEGVVMANRGGQLRPDDPRIQQAIDLLRTLPSDELAAAAELMRERSADDAVAVNERQHAGQLASVLEAMTRGVDPGAAVAFLADAGVGRN
jgi:hypothetical protein